MTTAHSPLHRLQAQADQIAAMLKAAECGGKIANDVSGKIAAARKNESITFAVAMDDKVLRITMAWSTIRETSRRGIAEFILDQMRESTETVH